jgi:hypothetical protein
MLSKSFRCFRSISIEKSKLDLLCSRLNTCNVSPVFNGSDFLCLQLPTPSVPLDKHAPLNIKTVRPKPFSPWSTSAPSKLNFLFVVLKKSGFVLILLKSSNFLVLLLIVIMLFLFLLRLITILLRVFLFLQMLYTWYCLHSKTNLTSATTDPPSKLHTLCDATSISADEVS